MKVKRRVPGKQVRVMLPGDTWLMLQSIARDLDLKSADLIRGCIAKCLPDLKAGKIEVEE